jgi:ABC-type Fe3+-siderophore transport system permease subunit
LLVLSGAAEIGWTATAGVVATAAGAHFNGSEVTAFALQTGAIAGSMLSTYLVFYTVAKAAGPGKLWLVGIFASSGVGIPVFIAAIISQRIFGHGKNTFEMDANVVSEGRIIGSKYCRYRSLTGGS